MFRMELGVKSRGKLGAVEVVSEYIVHNQAEEVRCTLLVEAISKYQQAKQKTL